MSLLSFRTPSAASLYKKSSKFSKKKNAKKVVSGADVFSELVGSWSLKFWVYVHGLNSNFARWDPEDGKAIEGQPEKGVKKGHLREGTFVAHYIAPCARLMSTAPELLLSLPMACCPPPPRRRASEAVGPDPTCPRHAGGRHPAPPPQHVAGRGGASTASAATTGGTDATRRLAAPPRPARLAPYARLPRRPAWSHGGTLHAQECHWGECC